MRLITNIGELEGKTVKSATFVDCDEKLVILFGDDTCAAFKVNRYGDSYDIEMTLSLQDYIKRDAGIISQGEYDVLEANEKAKRELDSEARERQTLERLKDKYES